MRSEAAAAAAGAANGGAGAGGPPMVYARHFAAALTRVQPSVSRKDQRAYDALRFKLRASRGR